MFCMECGKPLPDGAKFCAYCGKPQGKLPDPMPAAEPKPVQAPVQKPAAGPNAAFSEKNGSLVCVPGNGVYVLAYHNLCYIPEGEKTPKKLTRNRGKQDYYSMDYFQGELYTWYRDDDGFKLVAIDVNSHSKRNVSLPKNESPVLSGTRFQIQNGVGYCLLFGGKLLEMDLASGQTQVKRLPDIRTKPLLKSWKESGRFNAERSANFGNSYSYLYVSGGYGYASFLGSEYTAVRFRLDDPMQFSLVPENYCCVPTTHNGIISACGPWLVGTGRRADQLYLCQFDGNGAVSSAKSMPLESFQASSVKGWWRLGNAYVIGNLLLNFDTLKAGRLPFRSYADDFAPAEDGGVYIFDGALLYHLPAGFRSIIQKDSLTEFIVADIKKIYQ